jgi:hypothetical protein
MKPIYRPIKLKNFYRLIRCQKIPVCYPMTAEVLPAGPAAERNNDRIGGRKA